MLVLCKKTAHLYIRPTILFSGDHPPFGDPWHPHWPPTWRCYNRSCLVVEKWTILYDENGIGQWQRPRGTVGRSERAYKPARLDACCQQRRRTRKRRRLRILISVVSTVARWRQRRVHLSIEDVDYAVSGADRRPCLYRTTGRRPAWRRRRPIFLSLFNSN